MFFFFFFDNLMRVDKIAEAFKKVCADKMLLDGYVDMSTYINAKITKSEMLSKLEKEESRFCVLYSSAFPKRDKAFEFWIKKFPNVSIYDMDELTPLEAKAIVYWVYKIIGDLNERISFTKEFFRTIKSFYDIKNNIEFENGVFYNKEKVELHFINSLEKFDNFLVYNTRHNTKQLFFRGHSNANYMLKPSIMRNQNWIENENKMYNEIIINCPDDFSKCNTYLEKLVMMQHYGLPTRLLDITRNPLVALYFACESNYDSFGEVVLIGANESEIKYPSSDSVSVLSSLSLFDRNVQENIKESALYSKSDEQFNSQVPRLHHAVRLEKPAFLPEIKKEDIVDSFIVCAIKNNNRIIKQDGAFIICGLIDDAEALNKYRLKNEDKRIVLLIDNKQDILKSLNNFSINKATLFPEIECVTEYIKNKYS